MTIYTTLGIVAICIFLLQFALWEIISCKNYLLKSISIGLFIIFLGLLGARFNIVCLYFDYFIKYPLESFMIWKGGAVYTGSIIGVIVAILFLWIFFRTKIKIYSMCDSIALSLPIPHIIGRFGCLANGCCFGKPTHLPWAIKYNSTAVIISHEGLATVPIHPTQIYEIIAEMICIVFLLVLRKQMHGRLFGVYLLIYGSFRFFIEFVRFGTQKIKFGVDSQLLLSQVQIVCIGFVLLGVFILKWKSNYNIVAENKEYVMQ